MGAGFIVHEVRPAPVAVAGWLNRIIGPSLEACRFSGAWPPIEFRPITECGGFTTPKMLTTDERVCVTSRAKYWSKNGLRHIIIHEISHRIVMNYECEMGFKTDAHGPIFFLTFAALLARVDTTDGKESDTYSALNGLGLYDFQDCPKLFDGLPRCEWAPQILGWALSHVDALSKSNIPAEGLASAAAKKWVDFHNSIEKKKAVIDAATAVRIDVQTSLNKARANTHLVFYGMLLSWCLGGLVWVSSMVL